MKRDPPFDIPAGSTVDLVCIVETRQAGPFESDIHLYLDDVYLVDLKMTVRGTAVE